MFDQAIKQQQFRIAVSKPDLANLQIASTLLISCVDFRLRNETSELMNNHLNLLDDYDEISMPGAALALVEPKYHYWSATILDIVQLLEKLHQIKRIILLDHRDCGAYNLIKGKEHASTRELETECHLNVFKQAKIFLKEKFPNLEVYALLLSLDGLVENFTKEIKISN